jgi:hypothetical protein
MKELNSFAINKLIENFISKPLFDNLIKPFSFWGKLAAGTLPFVIDMFDSSDDETAQLIDEEKIRLGQAKTQSLVDEQLKQGEDLIDPESELKQKVLSVLTQQAGNIGAQTAGNVSKIAAQTGVTGGQATMAAQDSLNKALGGVGDTFSDSLNQRLSQGMNLKNQMISHQKGLDENLMNVEIGNVNAMNALLNEQMKKSGDDTSLLSLLDKLEAGIGEGGLKGITDKWGEGGEGFMGQFGTGKGALANLFKGWF